jgi:hypothetical protein
MDKTAGARRQLLTAVSVLGVSLGMADVAHAAKDDVTSTQTSHKGQTSLKIESAKVGQRSIKLQTGQHSLKISGNEMSSQKHQTSIKGQHSLKLDDQASHKVSSYNQNSYKEHGARKVSSYNDQNSYKEQTSHKVSSYNSPQ